MNGQRFWVWLNACLLFCYVSLLLVWKKAYGVFPLMAALGVMLGLFVCIRFLRLARLDREDACLILALLTYSGLWLLDVWRTGVWPQGEDNQGMLLPLWPLLAVVLLVWMRLYSPSPRVLWRATCCGALGAGSIACYERFLLGKARASNGMNSIPFGNLSLLLGALSLLAAVWYLRRGYARHNSMVALALLAALAGLLASLLSGTRGGWIALPFLLFLVYRAAGDLIPTGCRYGLVGLVVLMVLTVSVVPQSGVLQRASLAVTDMQQYWQGKKDANSVGTRLEMWRGGILLTRERPLLGWGEGRLEQAIDRLVSEGILPRAVGQHNQLHSDLIDTTARRGLVGLGSLMVLYGVPLWLFWRYFRTPGGDPGVRVFATAGMMVPVAFIEFGLTQSMLRDVRGLSAYLGLCVAFWVALRAHEPRVPEA